MPPKWICKLEFKRQNFVGFNERPVEYKFVFKHLSQIYPQKILDVGTGTSALPHLMRTCGFLVTAIDNIKDYWPAGITNRHWHVIDDDITDSHIKGGFDFITCISVLEHIRKSESAVRNMFNLLRIGGHMILTFPYTEKLYFDNVYKIPGSDAYGKNIPFICQSFSRTEIANWIKKNNGVIIEQQYWRFWEGDCWSVGNNIILPRMVSSEEKHQLTCILIKKEPS